MDETTIKLDDLPDRYAFCDPASSKKDGELKMVKARSAIITITHDWLGRIFVLEAWAKRCSTDDLIERIYRTHDTWALKSFGIEANAMQSLFSEAVARDARLRGKQLPIRPIHQPTRVQKPWRIRTILQPVIASGRLFVPDSFTELRTEIAAFPLSPMVDMVDALASAIAMMPKRPLKRQSDEEVESLLSYLRKTGAPPHVIEEVARKRSLR